MFDFFAVFTSLLLLRFVRQTPDRRGKPAVELTAALELASERRPFLFMHIRVHGLFIRI